MIASNPWLQSALNFFLNRTSSCYVYSQTIWTVALLEPYCYQSKLWLRPAFWSPDITTYLVLSAFTSSPPPLLATTEGLNDYETEKFCQHFLTYLLRLAGWAAVLACSNRLANICCRLWRGVSTSDVSSTAVTSFLKAAIAVCMVNYLLYQCRRYLLTYLLTYLLHGAGSFLRS